MNMKHKLALALGCFVSFAANSAFTMSGTRYVYNADVSAIPVVVTNHANKIFGGQIWLENTTDTKDIPFAVMPSLFTLGPDAKQTVQLTALESDSLSQTQESQFWINLQEIPSKDKTKSLEGNSLMMAARTKVKLLYRPKGLDEGRRLAEEKVTITRQYNQLTFNNPTPYYFAVVGINGNYFTDNKQLTSFSPFSKVSIAAEKVTGNTLSFMAIDDWGETNTFNCDLSKAENQCQFVKAGRKQ